jgi:hypothetical protein
MDRAAWARFFPLPFVGVSVLLVLLILLTPNLLLGGRPAAGSLATQAELTIDLPPGDNVTHFYVNGLSSVRYAMIAASICTNLTWPAPASLGGLEWANATWGVDVLAAQFSAAANPVAVNVTAIYVDAAGASVAFWAVFEFYVTDGTLYGAPLAPGQSTFDPTPVDSLPVTVLLASGAPGAVP